MLPVHQTIRILPKKRSFPDKFWVFQQKAGFQFKELDNCVLYFHLIFYDEAILAKISESIRVDDELHVQLQYNGMPIPLPHWYSQHIYETTSPATAMNSWMNLIKETFINHNSVFCRPLGQLLKISNKKISPIHMYTYFWQFLTIFNRKKRYRNKYICINTK